MGTRESSWIPPQRGASGNPSCWGIFHYPGEGSSKANHSGLKTGGLTVGSLMGPACSLKRPLRPSPTLLGAPGPPPQCFKPLGY